MAGRLDTEALTADQWLQEAVMNDAAHSPQEPAASASHGIAQEAVEADATTAIDVTTINLTSEASTGPRASTVGISNLEPEMRYTDLKKDLRKAIDVLDSFGSFAACGGPKGVSVPDPTISVKGVGLINLPMDDVQAQRLKQMAYQESVDEDIDTVTDTSVGNTCELGPHMFEIANPNWRQLVEKATLWAAQQLGIKTVVSAQLEKMLLYETGPASSQHTEYVSHMPPSLS